MKMDYKSATLIVMAFTITVLLMGILSQIQKRKTAELYAILDCASQLREGYIDEVIELTGKIPDIPPQKQDAFFFQCAGGENDKQ